MAETYFPFDAGAGADTTEANWRKMARLWLTTGVIDGELNEFAVSERAAGANMSVDVASGRAWIEGHFYESDAVQNKAISAADATNPRIDRVVLRADFSANTVSTEVLTGTPAVSPSAPALTQNTSRWEISLAQISVPAADTTISNSQITDERTQVARGNATSGPTLVRKSADESVTSSTTLQDDDALTFSIAANETFVGHMVLIVGAGAEAADVKVALSVPSGATADHAVMGLASTATDIEGSLKAFAFTTNTALGIDNASPTVVLLTFAVANGATPGSVTLQWAQQSSSATATTVKRGSYLVAHKVA